MKITRDYILGLGSGLVVSALIMFAMQWSGFGVVSDINRETAGQNLSAQKQTVESQTNANDNSANNKAATAETNPVNADSEIQDNKVQSGLQQDIAVEDNASSVNSAEKNSASSQEISFIVPNGASASSISDSLEQQGIITDKQAFMEAVGQLNVANKFQAGTFTLQKGLSVYEIIGILIQNPK